MQGNHGYPTFSSVTNLTHTAPGSSLAAGSPIQVPLRFEDLTQDGRLVLEALPNALAWVFAAPNGLGGLPVDAIKFDKTFVASLTAADKTTPLASALIAAARASRMTIFATGIETEKQMWAIRRMGCDVLQGDYIARPFTAMTAGEALAERLKMQSSGRD